MRQNYGELSVTILHRQHHFVSFGNKHVLCRLKVFAGKITNSLIILDIGIFVDDKQNHAKQGCVHFLCIGVRRCSGLVRAQVLRTSLVDCWRSLNECRNPPKVGHVWR